MSAKSSKKHRCYFCGEKGERVFIPICKGCLNSFNEYIEKALKEEEA